jgi:hypothetical protein
MRHLRFLLIAAIFVMAMGASQIPTRVDAKSNNYSLSTTPTSLNFGNIIAGTTSPSQTVTVTNLGSTNVTLGTLYKTDTIRSEFVLRAANCNGKTLAPTRSCTFTVAFAPKTTGYKTGSVVIPSDDPASPKTVTITGTGITGTNLLLSPNFELPIKKPIPWKVYPNSFTLFSALDCSISVSPLCSIRLSGNPNYAKSIAQSIYHMGLIGDSYLFRLSSRARDIPAGGQYGVEVQLLNMYNQVVGIKTINFTDGTHEFETATGIITARAQYSWIVFRFVLQKNSGTAWFDNAQLIDIP